MDEATTAINQLKTAQVNVEAGGAPDTSSEQAKVAEAQAALNNDWVKIAKDKISEWQAAKAACDATIEKYEEWILSSVSGNEGYPNQVPEDEYNVAKTNRATYQRLIKEKQDQINADPAAVTAYNNKVNALAEANKNWQRSRTVKQIQPAP